MFVETLKFFPTHFKREPGSLDVACMPPSLRKQKSFRRAPTCYSRFKLLGITASVGSLRLNQWVFSMSLKRQLKTLFYLVVCYRLDEYFLAILDMVFIKRKVLILNILNIWLTCIKSFKGWCNRPKIRYETLNISSN